MGLGMLVCADFRGGLQYQKTVKKLRCASRKLKKTAGIRRSRVLLPLFKAVVRLRLENWVPKWKPNLVRDMDMLE